MFNPVDIAGDSARSGGVMSRKLVTRKFEAKYGHRDTPDEDEVPMSGVNPMIVGVKSRAIGRGNWGNKYRGVSISGLDRFIKKLLREGASREEISEALDRRIQEVRASGVRVKNFEDRYFMRRFTRIFRQYAEGEDISRWYPNAPNPNNPPRSPQERKEKALIAVAKRKRAKAWRESRRNMGKMTEEEVKTVLRQNKQRHKMQKILESWLEF